MTELLDLPDGPEPNPDYTLTTPSFAQIEWMKSRVQATGGVPSDMVHRPEAIAYPAEDGVRTVMVNTCGCGNESIAFVKDADDRMTKVCIVCDGLIEWPALA